MSIPGELERADARGREGTWKQAATSEHGLQARLPRRRTNLTGERADPLRCPSGHSHPPNSPES